MLQPCFKRKITTGGQWVQISPNPSPHKLAKKTQKFLINNWYFTSNASKRPSFNIPNVIRIRERKYSPAHMTSQRSLNTDTTTTSNVGQQYKAICRINLRQLGKIVDNVFNPIAMNISAVIVSNTADVACTNSGGAM